MNGLREKFCHSHDLKLHFVVSQGGKAEGNLPKLRLKKLHVEPWSERGEGGRLPVALGISEM